MGGMEGEVNAAGSACTVDGRMSTGASGSGVSDARGLNRMNPYNPPISEVPEPGLRFPWSDPMTVSFDLPSSIQEVVASLGPDVSETIKEAALVDLYRREVISHVQLTAALGLSRLEVDRVLKAHGVYHPITIAQHDADLEALRRLVVR